MKIVCVTQPEFDEIWCKLQPQHRIMDNALWNSFCNLRIPPSMTQEEILFLVVLGNTAFAKLADPDIQTALEARFQPEGFRLDPESDIWKKKAVR